MCWSLDIEMCSSPIIRVSSSLHIQLKFYWSVLESNHPSGLEYRSTSVLESTYPRCWSSGIQVGWSLIIQMCWSVASRECQILDIRRAHRRTVALRQPATHTHTRTHAHTQTHKHTPTHTHNQVIAQQQDSQQYAQMSKISRRREQVSYTRTHTHTHTEREKWTSRVSERERALACTTERESQAIMGRAREWGRETEIWRERETHRWWEWVWQRRHEDNENNVMSTKTNTISKETYIL